MDRSARRREVDELLTITEFATHEDQGITSFVARKRHFAGDGALLKSFDYFYDGPEFVGLARGKVTEGYLPRQAEVALTEGMVAAAYGDAPASVAPIVSNALDDLYQSEDDPDLGTLRVKKRGATGRRAWQSARDTRRARAQGDDHLRRRRHLAGRGRRRRLRAAADGVRSRRAASNARDRRERQHRAHEVRRPRQHDRGVAAGRRDDEADRDLRMGPHRGAAPGDAAGPSSGQGLDARLGTTHVLRRRDACPPDPHAHLRRQVGGRRRRHHVDPRPQGALHRRLLRHGACISADAPAGVVERSATYDAAGRLASEHLFNGSDTSTVREPPTRSSSIPWPPRPRPAIPIRSHRARAGPTPGIAWPRSSSTTGRPSWSSSAPTTARPADARRRCRRQCRAAQCVRRLGNAIRVDSSETGTIWRVFDEGNAEVARIDADARVLWRARDDQGRAVALHDGGPTGAVEETYTYDAGPGKNLNGRLAGVEERSGRSRIPTTTKANPYVSIAPSRATRRSIESSSHTTRRSTCVR